MPAPKVVCLGEAMVEVALNRAEPGSAGIGFAGDTLNTAIYLKRSLPAADVAYATKAGRDVLSDSMVEFMRSEGLNTSLVGFSETKLPGLYAISTDKAGERSFLYWRNDSAARDLFSPPALSLESLMAFDVIYFSAISLAVLPSEDRGRFLAWLPHFRSEGGIVAFDSNYRANLWPDVQTAQSAITSAWRQTDIGLPGFEDEQALFGDRNETELLDRLRKLGVKSGALKRGSRGPVSLNGTTSGNFPAISDVVDSTAAGDSFSGAYLAARLSGLSEQECLIAGHALASQVIRFKGAIIPHDETV